MTPKIQDRDLTILLIEDTPEDAERVETCLSNGLSRGFLVDRTQTLKASLSNLERFDYDVALVDLSLPDCAGLAIVEAVLEVSPELPLIVLTSLDDEDLALQCIEAGAQDYVIKGDCGIEVLVRSLHFAMQRKNAQEALRQSELRYRYLFEQSLAGVYVTDRVGRVLDCNGAFAETLGARSRREILELPARDLYFDAEQAARLRQALSDEGELRNEEIQLRRVDGEPVRVLANIALIDEKEGHGSVVQGTVLDITKQRRWEQRIHKARQMEAIGRLAGGVAHDFNNILTSIIGYAELSLDDTESGSGLHGNLLEIQEAGRRAAVLTRQLLAFSRRQVLRPSRLDLNEVVREFEGLIKSSVGEGVELVLSLDPELNEVVADRGQLEMVLMDLALNSRDAMPAGGSLTILTANVDLDAIFAHEHAGSSVGPHVMLSVADTGCGMDEDTRKNIFEPFFTTQKASRSGLGLAAVYGVVKQSGGYVQVDSEVGVGSSFDVYLPRAVGVGTAATDESVCSGAVPDGRKILVAEDDRGLRTMAEKVLSSQGYEVLTASGPAEALAIREESRECFDLLITDLVMPGMSGLELAKRLTERDPGLRVLLMSGYPRDRLLEEDPFAARAAFIGKPFKPSDLSKEVRMVLEVDPRGSSASTCRLGGHDIGELIPLPALAAEQAVGTGGS